MFLDYIICEGLGVEEFYVPKDGGGEVFHNFSEGVLRDFQKELIDKVEV